MSQVIDEDKSNRYYPKLYELTPTHVGEWVTLRVQLEKSKTPQLILQMGVWTCRECGGTTEKFQPKNEKKLTSPRHCKICLRTNCLSFSSHKSTYLERQVLSCTFGSNPLEVEVDEELCKQEGYERGTYDVSGLLSVKSNSKQCNKYCMTDVVNITKIKTETFELEETPVVIRDDVSPAWRREVLKRDNCCVICGGEKHLEAHHIFGYKGYPELRDNVDNGITLCQFCHGNYHSQYGVKNPNPVTFVNFIKGFR